MKKLSLLVLSLLFAQQAFGLEQELKSLVQSLVKLAGDLGGGGTPPPPSDGTPPPPPTRDEIDRLDLFAAKTDFTKQDINAAMQDLANVEQYDLGTPEQRAAYRKLLEERSQQLGLAFVPPSPAYDEVVRLQNFALKTDFTEQDINTAREDLEYVEKHNLVPPFKRAEWKRLIEERSKHPSKPTPPTPIIGPVPPPPPPFTGTEPTVPAVLPPPPPPLGSGTITEPQEPPSTEQEPQGLLAGIKGAKLKKTSESQVEQSPLERYRTYVAEWMKNLPEKPKDRNAEATLNSWVDEEIKHNKDWNPSAKEKELLDKFNIDVEGVRAFL